jgi:chromosome segregation ATPase
LAELTLEMLRAELAPIGTRLDALSGEVAAMRARVDGLGGDVAGLRAEIAAIRPNVEGIPLLQRAISIIHQEQRMMKAAINEIARTQFTSAEVEALHSDVNSVQATHLELETRILTLEREVKETKNALAALKQR